MNRFTLASVERAQSPLGFIYGYNLCGVYNLSLRWLAEGFAPHQPFTPVAAEILKTISPRSSFFRAYDLGLAGMVKDRLEEIAKQHGVAIEGLDKVGVILDRRRTGVTLADSHFEQVVGFLTERARELGEDKKIEFANQLSNVGFGFWNIRPDESKPLVDTTTPPDTVPAVSFETPTWKQLVKELKRRTNSPGAKAQLAADLKTSRQNVNKWLSGAGAPSAELTLAVLRWVRKQA